MTEIARAFVALAPTTAGFGKATERQLGSELGKSGKKIGTGFGKAVKLGAGVALAGLTVGGAFLKGTIDAASDLNETLSKSSVIFGKQAPVMNTWAKGAARAAGLSRQAALEAAASFGDMFGQLGFGGKEAAKMSRGVVQLSADLGSFNNLPTAEVADMMSAAFRGEFDSLQRLVPNINAARVEQVALATTGKASAQALTAQEKAAATLAIVQKDGARAAGDFARTSGGLANQQKILGAQFENVKSSIGQKLLPVAVRLATWFNDKLMPATSRLWGWLEEKLGPVFRTVGGFIADTLVPAVRDLWQRFTTAGDGTSKLKRALSDAQPFFSAAKTMLGNLGRILRDVVLPVLGTIADHALPFMGRAFGAIGEVMRFTWNTIMRPAFIAIGKAVSVVMRVWAGLLGALGKIPKFGWARDAGRAMGKAADEAWTIGDNLKKIPKNPEINLRHNLGGAVELSAQLRANLAAAANTALAGFGLGGNPISGRAAGGPVDAGRLYLVGENGPELFTTSQSGRIIPNHQLPTAGGSGQVGLKRGTKLVLLVDGRELSAIVDERVQGNLHMRDRPGRGGRG